MTTPTPFYAVPSTRTGPRVESGDVRRPSVPDSPLIVHVGSPSRGLLVPPTSLPSPPTSLENHLSLHFTSTSLWVLGRESLQSVICPSSRRPSRTQTSTQSPPFPTRSALGRLGGSHRRGRTPTPSTTSSLVSVPLSDLRGVEPKSKDDYGRRERFPGVDRGLILSTQTGLQSKKES